MTRGFATRIVRVAVAAAAGATMVLGMAGCSLTTPSLSEVEQAETTQAIDDSALVQAGTLTVALDTDDAPQVMSTSGDALEGYDIDVAIMLAQELGLEVAFVSASSAEDALTSGEADIFLGATAADESDEIVVDGEFLQNATGVFALDTTTASVSITTLQSATIGVQDASVSQDVLANAGMVASNTYSNVNECFEALVAGEVDYVVCDATAGGYLARSYENVSFLGTLSEATSYGIAYLSSATEVIEEVGAAIENISADGTLSAIHALWYGDTPLSLSSELISGVSISSSSSSDEDSDDEQISGDMNSLD